LKKDLKSKTKSAYPDERWNDDDEREFVNKLERELEKCEDFQLTKAEELSERIESLEKTVHGLVKAYDSQQGNGNGGDKPSSSQLESQNQEDAAALDGGSDDEDDGADDEDETRSEASYDETFKDMEEEVATLVADVHDLALYTKLNFTGFMKIVKKHDVSPARFSPSRH
jgi:SPX domain protein involved in polyphosphate accumulation